MKYPKSKSEPKREVVQEKVKVTKPLYRYFCNACTGIAFMSDVIAVKGTEKCQVCGSTFDIEEKNYIKA